MNHAHTIHHFVMPKGRTVAVFREQGACSARSGNMRTPGNEYRMPSFGEGTSWQAKAFAAGFRDECAKMGRTVLSGD